MPDISKNSHSIEYPKLTLKAEFTGNGSLERHRIKWEVVGKDAARRLRCRNWKLTVQNGTVWMQNLWEAKG